MNDQVNGNCEATEQKADELGQLCWAIYDYTHRQGKLTTVAQFSVRSVGRSRTLVRVMFDEAGVVLERNALRAYEFRSNHDVVGRLYSDARVCVQPTKDGFEILRMAEMLAGLIKLEQLCSASWRGMVRVASAGKGPTNQSRKVRVLLTTALTRDMEHEEWGVDKETAVAVLTVPTSAIQEVDGQLYIPRRRAIEIAQERIRQRDGHRRASEARTVLGLRSVDGSPNSPPTVIAALRSIGQALNEQLAEIAIGAPERSAEIKIETEKALAVLAEAESRRNAEMAKLAEQQARREKRAAAARTKLETIEGANVVWASREGTSKVPVLVLRKASGCTVQFSGDRVYLIFANGNELIKTRNTVQINDEVLPPGHTVHQWRAKGISE